MSDRGTQAAGEDQEIRPAPGPASSSRDAFAPWSRAFLRHAALWLMAAIAGGLVLAGIADSLLHRLAGFLQIILISLFLSFAIEPAVGYLAKRGWHRGAATGLVFLAVLMMIAGLIALLIPAIVTGTHQLIAALPDLVHNLARYLKPLGIRVDQVNIEDQMRKYGNQLLTGAGTLLGGIVRVATGIVSGVFQALAIALFTFYMAAQGPQMRRTVCSRFRPDRQRRILFIWEQAIEQTGGYFYSRLLLAVINGAQGHELGDVVAVAAGQRDRQRDPVRFGDQVVLGAGPGTIDRARAGFGPPFIARTCEPSITALEKSSAPAACSSASSDSCSRCQTPASCQSRSRRQQVIPDPKPSSCGKNSHGIPVYRTNKMPHRTFRSSSRFRPG